MDYRGPNALTASFLVLLMSLLVGCAGLEYSPDRHFLYYHKELPAADRALEEAAKAGKNKECPGEYEAAEKMKQDAYGTYRACRTREGIEKANKAAAMANALCPEKAEAPKPPPAAPPPVTVAPPPPAPKVIDRLTVRVNFDSDKADIREADIPELRKAIDFVQKYPDHNIAVEGHTDDRGSATYNQALSERRAEAVKEYLLEHGVPRGDRIMATGYGETRPMADNGTAQGRFENRRVEILILSR